MTPSGAPRRCATARSSFVLALLSIAAVVVPDRLHAACNIIPSASKTFRFSLGAVNRPFAAPGDFVEVSVDPANCDPASPGLVADPLQQLVTLVYTPAAPATRSMVVLAADCTSSIVLGKIKACQKQPGFTTPITCVS